MAGNVRFRSQKAAAGGKRGTVAVGTDTELGFERLLSGPSRPTWSCGGEILSVGFSQVLVVEACMMALSAVPCHTIDVTECTPL